MGEAMPQDVPEERTSRGENLSNLTFGGGWVFVLLQWKTFVL